MVPDFCCANRLKGHNSARNMIFFIAFSIVKCEYIIFFNDYPDAVVNNAKRGIELNEKNGNNCATRVGKLRATTLSKRGNLSLSTIRRMYSYLSRAEEYYDPNDTTACGTISFLLWGGLAGKRWAEAKLKAAGILEQ